MERPTQIFIDHLSGDGKALDRFVPLVYDELRSLAQKYMKKERRGHTLSPTALVHEAYLRLIDQSKVDWKRKTQFFAIAANTMRRVLVNHAKSKQAEKRGGKYRHLTIMDEQEDRATKDPLDVIALDDCLQRLAKRHERQARVVELRFFGALKIKEIAEVLDVSERTITEDWRVARAWLLCELSEAAG